jgi:hypothetical protein
MSAVQPSSFCRFGSAPAWISASTVAVWPLSAARTRATIPHCFSVERTQCSLARDNEVFHAAEMSSIISVYRNEKLRNCAKNCPARTDDSDITCLFW